MRSLEDHKEYLVENIVNTCENKDELYILLGAFLTYLRREVSLEAVLALKQQQEIINGPEIFIKICGN